MPSWSTSTAVVHGLLAGTLTRDEARDRVARIVSAGRRRRAWAVTLGWGAMGTGVALTLGGDTVVCVLALLAAVAIDRTQALLPFGRIPPFYHQRPEVSWPRSSPWSAAATRLEVNPSRVVTAGIVMLLAGVGVTGSHRGCPDRLSGHGHRAAARCLPEHCRHHRRVGAGLTVGGLLTVDLGSFTPGAAALAARAVAVLGCGTGGLRFRVRVLRAGEGAAGGRTGRRCRPGSGVGGRRDGPEPHLGSRRCGPRHRSHLLRGVESLPSAAPRPVVPSIVPLLPGLDIYRGLALLAAGKDGVLQLASAFATALALAAGVLLGQYLASPLKREARRLESPLSSPHTLEPFRKSHDPEAPGGGSGVSDLGT